MAAASLSDWSFHPVACAECEIPLQRRLLHPKTKAPINRFFCNHVCKGSWQKRAQPVSREWLIQKYSIECLDCVEIGRLVGRDPKSVWNWLKGWGIPTRARGGAENSPFKKGQPSLFLGHKQKRGAASPHWRGGVTPERQAFNASPEWKEAIGHVYARAGKQCQRCTKPAVGQRSGFHVHHGVPFTVREKRLDLDNLFLLCPDCHRFVHSRKNVGKEFILEAIQCLDA